MQDPNRVTTDNRIRNDVKIGIVYSEFGKISLYQPAIKKVKTVQMCGNSRIHERRLGRQGLQALDDLGLMEIFCKI